MPRTPLLLARRCRLQDETELRGITNFRKLGRSSCAPGFWWVRVEERDGCLWLEAAIWNFGPHSENVLIMFFIIFFTTLIVLNTCLNYYLFFLYEEVTDLLLSIVRPETDLLLSIVRPETDLLLTENSVKTEVSCGKDRMWRRF